MKFSIEAMRDVLLFIEKDSTYREGGENRKLVSYNMNMIISNSYFTELFSKHKYSKDELQYTIEKMIEGKILNIAGSLHTYYEILDISYEGIQLLNSIRPETTWEKTKSIANKIGNHALYFIEDTAQKITLAATSTLIGG